MIIALGYLPFSFFVFNVDRDSLTCFQDLLKGSCAQFETPGLSTTELHPWGRRRTGVGVCGGGCGLSNFPESLAQNTFLRTSPAPTSGVLIPV